MLAGVLQDHFYSADRPQYMNYGSIGSVIGHEITHGFDDEGRQFDGNGNLNEWWEPATSAAYLQKVKCIIEQYGNFTEPMTGLNVSFLTIRIKQNIFNIFYVSMSKYIVEWHYHSR